jgi:1-acyl-sn-glycerol-3-phosphate acyltransferase
VSFYRFARAVVLSVFKVLFRVHVVGREHVPTEGVYIVAPSHRSIFDVPFAAFVSKRRIRFMAKDELFSTRFGGWLFKKLGAIKVDREATDRGALRASQQALQQGEPLAIFPEGTRRSGPTIEDLFDGVAYLAGKLDVPILPVGIGGTQEILPSGKVLPRIHKVAIVIGQPISPATGQGTTSERTTARRVRKRSEIAALTAMLQTSLQAAFDEANRRAGATPELRPPKDALSGAPNGPDGALSSAAEARQHV